MAWTGLSGLLREIEPVFARSDVYAQLLRARLVGEACGVLPLDETSAAHEAEQAASFQVDSDYPRIAGGFLFGRKQGECTAIRESGIDRVLRSSAGVVE